MVSDSYTPRIVEAELDELMRGLPALLLQGPKAVGKTETARRRATTVHQLDDDAERDVAAANLDRILASDPPVLLDEWQRLPPLWDRVRRAVDENNTPGRFLLTGSASPEGLGSHSGAGRIADVRLRPMSLAERRPGIATVSLSRLLSGTHGDIDGRTDLALNDYVDEILRSGFPAIRELPERAREAQLASYVARVVDRDFPELRSVRNPARLRAWMAAYASATATTTSFEKLRAAATIGASAPPARSTSMPYVDVLTRLFILDPLPGWRPRSHLRELTEAPKHHLADPALAATLVNVSSEGLLAGKAPGAVKPRDGTFLGALFESLVTQSVRVYAQAARASTHHFRTHRGEHEVDLIVEGRDSRVLALEVKLTATPPDDAARDLTWLADRFEGDVMDRVIVTTGREAYRRADGAAVVPAALLGP